MPSCEFCKTRASYGFRGAKAKYCAKHKKEGMINFYVKYCEFENCNVIACFGYKGGKKQFCVKHKKEDMIDVTKKICNVKNCEQRADYKWENKNYCNLHNPNKNFRLKECEVEKCHTMPSYGYKDKKAARCADHALPGMINVVAPRCKAVDCKKIATFSFEKHPPKFCREHKLEGMIGKRKRCKYSEGCNATACFGIKGESAQFCKEHSTSDMIIVGKIYCKKIGCKVSARYNFKGTERKYCNAHKKEGMINVVDKICDFPGCERRPTFGKKGTILAIYCSKHKDIGMVPVVGKLCQEDDCGKNAVFGIKGTKTRLYCKKHKEEDMVDVSGKKTCEEEKCDTRPSYAYKGEKARFCIKHKMLDMIDVNHAVCVHKKCIDRAYYGKLFTTFTHCGKHKKANMFMKIKPKCEKCTQPAYYALDKSNYPTRCEEHSNKKYTNLIEVPCIKCGTSYLLGKTKTCDYCLVPEKLQHKKELEIKELFDKHKLKYEGYDKIVDIDCSLRRPDFVFDMPTFKIVVEVDENQHSSYACECEQTRMIQIHQSFGGTPVLFVRYNPDSFKMNRKKQNIDKKERHAALLRVIKSFTNVEELEKPLSVIYLFYDDYDEEMIPVEISY